MIKNRTTLFLKYSLFWLLFFAFSRFIFLLYNFRLSSDIPFDQLVMTFIKGFKLDLSVTGYLVFFVALIIAGTSFASNKVLSKILNIYTLILLVLFSIITISDMELYRNWGFRMDSTVLLYLKTPKEALASTKVWLFIVLLICTAALIFAAYRFYKKLLNKVYKQQVDKNWLLIPIFILIAGSMIIPIRGGVGIAPINTGAVYFSNFSYANHAAVNVHWQIGNSLAYMNKNEKFHLLDDEVAKQSFGSLYNTNNDTLTSFTSIEKPNIAIIILESFSARMIEPLGGLKGVTPNLNKLATQGILFTHCIANGDRSDKGIVSILSGYPAQPKTSIIKNSVKAEKLPFLCHKLNNIGYQSAFYYGGDINFANMRSYLVNSKFDKLITMFDFDEKDRNSKWGIHDHVVFNKFFDDCNTDNKPFFKAFFTLSSHEPFDVPHKSRFNQSDEESMFLNSAHYTDSCLGDFINKAKKQSWWDSTLVVFVADHSGRFPGNIPYSSVNKFKIPLLIVGGALNVTDTLINTTINQIDLPTLIGQQLNKNYSDFKFSKTNFSGEQSFAFFAFNNGFGYIKDSSGFVFDNTSKQIMTKSPNITDDIVTEGKAYMQTLLNDYNSK